MVHSSKVKAMSGVKELLNWIFCLAASPAFESFQIWLIFSVMYEAEAGSSFASGPLCRIGVT